MALKGRIKTCNYNLREPGRCRVPEGGQCRNLNVGEAVHCSPLEPPHPLPLSPKGARGGVNLNSLPSPPWGRGWSRRAGPSEGVPPRRRVRRAALRRFLRHLVGPTHEEAVEQETVELEVVEQEAQIPVRCGG